MAIFKKSKKHKLRDVILDRRRVILSFRSRRIVDLKPFFLQKHRILGLGLILLLGGALVFFSQRFFTQAEVEDFYPSTCLGSWKNPEGAQGEPTNFLNNDASVTSTFDEVNSSFLASREGQIFCGGFVPSDFDMIGKIKSVGLTLVWDISDLPPPIATQDESFPKASESSTENSSASSSDELKLDHPEEGSDASPDTPAIESTSTSKGPSFFEFSLRTNIFGVPLAFATGAQEVSSESTSSIAPDLVIIPQVTTPTQDDGESQTSTAVENLDSNSVSSTPDIRIETLETNLESGGGTESSATSSSEEGNQPPELPDRDFLKVSYSLDGQSWFPVMNVSPDNWKNLTFSLPIYSWSDMNKLQISIEGKPSVLDMTPKVFLDGMIAEVQYDVVATVSEEETDQTSEVSLPDDIPVVNLEGEEGWLTSPDKPDRVFGSDEVPAFDLDLKLLPTPPASSPPPSGLNLNGGGEGLSSSGMGYKNLAKVQKRGLPVFGFRSLFSRVFARESLQIGSKTLDAINPMVAVILDPNERPMDLEPLLFVVNDALRVSLPEPPREFRPGKYKVNLWVLRNGVVYFTSTDFTWGVFAINFNKSIYKVGDSVDVGMAVLTDKGETICDAKISMRVITPSGEELNFSTRTGGIIYSDTCGPNNVTQEADYQTKLEAEEAGTYRVFVTTRTQNGLREFEDLFMVQEGPSFDVERSGPTRIYPLAGYKMTILVIPKNDFTGTVKEIIPASFELVSKNGTVEQIRDIKTITWNVELKGGEAKELSYFFNPPNVSPELYRLGPLGFFDSPGASQPVFAEVRKWQIAADSAGWYDTAWGNRRQVTIIGTSTALTDFPILVALNSSGSLSNINYSKTQNSGEDIRFTDSDGTTLLNYEIEKWDETGTSTIWVKVPTIATSTATTTIYMYYNNTSTADGQSVTSTWNSNYKGVWHLDQTVTSTSPYILDSTSNAWNATSSGTSFPLPTSTGQVDGAQFFDSTNDFLKTPNSSFSSNVLTISFWLDWTSFATADDLAMEHSNNYNNTAHTFLINPNSSAASAWQACIHGTSGFRCESRPRPAAGTKQHFSVVLDNSTVTGDVKIFLNGGESTTTVNRTDKGGSANFANALIAFMSRNGTGLYGGGTMDEVKISNLERSAAWNWMEWCTSSDNYSCSNTYGSEESPPAPMTVSSVVLNGGSAITLIPNATTTIYVNFTVTDPDGCADVFSNGNVTTTIYRSGVGGSCTANELNCYRVSTTTNNCSAGTSAIGTSTFYVYYFAQPTDVAPYESQNWAALVEARDSTSATSTATSTVELNSLLAINLVTSTINYGSLNPTSTTGAVNRVIPIENVGNVSTTPKVSATALKKGSESLATSSQHYASSSFFFGGSEQLVSDTLTTVSGLTLSSHTSSTNSLGTWTNTTDLHRQLIDLGSVARNGYLYQIGGQPFNPLDTAGTTTVSYAQIGSDGTIGAWTHTTALPTALSDHMTTYYANYLYVLAGSPEGSARTSTVIYAPMNSNGTIGSWTNTSAMPYGMSEQEDGVAVYGGYLYVAGGRPEDGATVTTTVLYAKINADGSVGAWGETTPLPAARYDHAMATENGYVYVLGGKNVGNVCQSTVYYAPANSDGTLGSWNTTTAMLTCRQQDFTVDAWGGYLYVLGGNVNGNTTSSTMYGKVNGDGTITSWSYATPLSATTNRHAAAFSSGYGYVLGGYKTTGGTPTSSVFYTPVTNGKSRANTFWGLGLTDYVSTGTYRGTTTFSFVISP